MLLSPAFANANEHNHAHNNDVTPLELIVYKTPTCGCCKKWITHIEDKGNVTQDPRGVALELDGEICFDPGSVAVKESLQNILKNVKEKFMTNPDDLRGILIEGHSDNESIPPKLAEKYPTNWELSASRAAVVVNYLINDGVNPGRLSASGYADRWPTGATWNEIRSGIVDDSYIAQKNSNEEQRSKNRRIKIMA